MVTAQEGYKQNRKRGWTECATCGCGLNFSDKEIIESHISGKGCGQFNKLFNKKKK